ncbi:MAG: CRTAC1 family protein [Planctomycetes bacterium]|nr:CRTAC1 family protein [Planctomycetota bacterium]
MICLTLAATSKAQTAFTEQAVKRGLSYVVTQDRPQLGAGVALIDLDGDGDPDCVLMGREDGVVGIYENDGAGHFVDRSLGSGIAASIWNSAIAAADYDADGDLDLYISRYFAEDDSLYRNEGGFVFTDVSAAAGILPGGMGVGVAWGDYDNDGFLDLYVCNHTGSYQDPTRNRLYHNLGDGTFEEVALALGVQDDDEPTLLCTWLDYDEDGDADLYLGTDKGSGQVRHNALFQNQGDGTFIEVTQQTNTAAYVDCMGIAIGDFDLDGGKDLYVTNIPFGNVLLMSNGDGAFVDRTIEAGVGSYATGWGCAFFDYDHDMILDLYVCNMVAPNRFYRHQGRFPAQDIGPACGIADPETSYCMALGDVDMDGDLDLLVQSSNVNVRLYINGKGHLRNWVKLDVVGQGANRHAIGATLKIDAGGVIQTREIHAGANYKSDNERIVQLGLAGVGMIDAIDVLWPGGTKRTIRNMSANETWTMYPPERLGDADGDGDIDFYDIRAAIACLTGPGPGNLTPGCELFDMDSDGDVDYDDLRAMGVGFAAARLRP